MRKASAVSVRPVCCSSAPVTLMIPGVPGQACAVEELATGACAVAHPDMASTVIRTFSREFLLRNMHARFFMALLSGFPDPACILDLTPSGRTKKSGPEGPPCCAMIEIKGRSCELLVIASAQNLAVNAT